MALGTIPSGIEVESVTITSQNGKVVGISSLAPEIHIYEDVFCNTLSCQLVISDVAGMLERIPLVGNESVSIKLRKAELETLFQLEFVIYKIANIQPISPVAKIYTLECVSQEYIDNVLTLTSKAYSGPTESVISSILKNDLNSKKVVNVQPTSSLANIISAYWNPFYTINLLASRAIASKGGQPSYLLYESFDQQFHFKSLETLFSNQPVMAWIARDPNMATTTSSDSSMYRLSTIESYKIESAYDIVEGVMDGLLGGQLVDKDVLSKGCVVSNYNYLAAFNKPNSTPVISKGVKGVDLTKSLPRRVIKYSSTRLSANGDGKNYKAWALQRLSFIEQIDVVKLHLTVPGNSIVGLGSTVNVLINDAISADAGDKVSLSGKWTISAIHHRIKTGTYMMDVELIRDSLK